MLMFQVAFDCIFKEKYGISENLISPQMARTEKNSILTRSRKNPEHLRCLWTNSSIFKNKNNPTGIIKIGKNSAKLSAFQFLKIITCPDDFVHLLCVYAKFVFCVFEFVKSLSLIRFKFFVLLVC